MWSGWNGKSRKVGMVDHGMHGTRGMGVIDEDAPVRFGGGANVKGGAECVVENDPVRERGGVGTWGGVLIL